MVDKAKIEEAVKLLLEGIGEDVNREGLVETPQRIARMYEEIFGGMDEDPAVPLSKQFQAEGAGIVLEKDITFYSTCEHHQIPFRFPIPFRVRFLCLSGTLFPFLLLYWFLFLWYYLIRNSEAFCPAGYFPIWCCSCLRKLQNYYLYI